MTGWNVTFERRPTAVSVVIAAVVLSGAVGGPGLVSRAAAMEVVESPSATLSSDQLREVWAPGGCHCIWGRTRKTVSGPWSAPEQMLQIRGQIGHLAFSPDGTRLAFENPRGDRTVEAAGGDPALEGFSPARVYSWGFIAVFDLAHRRLSYVDPTFATDSDPAWAPDGTKISFTRHAEGVPATRLSRAPPAAEGLQASVSAHADLAPMLAAPIAFQPTVSRDGRVIAFVAREATRRTIYVQPVDGPARLRVEYAGDDGQELSAVTLSPRGDLLAYVRGGRPNKSGDIPNPRSEPVKPKRQVWLGSAAPGALPQPVGEGDAPQFSPDGASLVWSNPAGLVTALVLRSADGGVHLGPAGLLISGSADAYRFSPDGRRLAIQRGDGVFVYDLANDSRWLIPRASGEIDEAPVWSPDGRRLAMVHRTAPHDPVDQLGFHGPYVASRPWSLEVADLDTRKVTQIWQATAGRGSAFFPLDQDPTDIDHAGDQLLWTADDRIVFPWETDGWLHLYAVSAAGGTATLLTPGEGEVESAALTLDGKGVVVATNIGDPGRRHLARIDLSAKVVTAITPGEANQWGPTPVTGGGLAYVEANWATPPQVRIRDAGGRQPAAATPVLSKGFPTQSFVKPRLIELAAPDGATAYGQLFVPDRPSGCGVVFAHGGIKRQMLPGFHYREVYSHLYEVNQWIVRQGCAVLSIEYRSSIMRGHDFRNAAGWGNAGASEMLDVAGAAKYLRGLPELHVKRVGIWGLSWGGYITAQALARQPDLFQAGFDLAGVHEFFGDRADAAPEARIADWRAPVFLVQGDDDRNVDFYQGLSLAAQLRRRPNVEAVMRATPDEVHDLISTFENMVDVYGAGAEFLVKRLVEQKSQNEVRRR